MKQLLYLNAAGRQLWTKTDQGWQPHDGEPKGHVWIVTDFSEESIAEIKTPRLMPTDRSAFLARQLATRYPETPYRGYLTPDPGSDLLSRIAPIRHVAFGVDAAARLDEELDKGNISCAGVWPMSMLLAAYGHQRQLPADLLLLLPGVDVLRIVFLRNRTPVLTRLTITPNEPAAQIEEIVRTVRYLENTQILPRDEGNRSILFLGDHAPLLEAIGTAKLDFIDIPGDAAPADWRFPLFDLALTSPPGQVAPLTRRTRYLGDQLGKAAMTAIAVVVLAGSILASRNFVSMLGSFTHKNTLQESLRQVDEKISETGQSIQKFGVDPDTVRRAVALYDDEIASVPPMDQHFHLLADAIAPDPNLRVKDMQWTLLGPEEPPCGLSAEAMQSLAATDPATAGPPERRIQLSFELAMPETYGPRDRALTLRRVAGQLATVQGITVWQDAQKSLAGGRLSGGAKQTGGEKLGWCLTLPGKRAVTAVSREARP
jgi:hypothetical protein